MSYEPDYSDYCTTEELLEMISERIRATPEVQAMLDEIAAELTARLEQTLKEILPFKRFENSLVLSLQLR